MVGAGFSGVVASRELLRAGWQVVLVDPGARPGRGLAYSTAAPWHLLNSPASAMSIEPDDPGHFVRWCQARGVSGEFVSRGLYGDYLVEALRAADDMGSLTVHRGRVIRVFEGSVGMIVLLNDGVVIPADRVVLALGNPPPGWVRGATVQDPWAPGALDGLPDGPVTLIGSGLTAVDVALTLARGGRHPRIEMVSRHGLLPRAHASAGSFRLDGPKSRTLAGLMREIRQMCEGDWRGAMDALRPHWNDLWARLSPEDRERFLRHVARYWEVHRHRMAPAVAREVDELRAGGVLTLSTGLTGRYQIIINCTGPGRLIDVDPLVRSLEAEGLARRGPHGLGLDVDEHGALLPKRKIFTLGPARRGWLWETTAAPEIRAQARSLSIHFCQLSLMAAGVSPRPPARRG